MFKTETQLKMEEHLTIDEKSLDIADFRYQPSSKPRPSLKKLEKRHRKEKLKKEMISTLRRARALGILSPHTTKETPTKTMKRNASIKSVKSLRKKYVNLSLNPLDHQLRYRHLQSPLTEKARKTVGRCLTQSSDQFPGCVFFNRTSSRLVSTPSELMNLKEFISKLPIKHRPDSSLIFRLEAGFTDLIKDKNQLEELVKSGRLKHDTQIKSILRQSEKSSKGYKNSLKKIAGLERELASMAKKISYLERENMLLKRENSLIKNDRTRLSSRNSSKRRIGDQFKF